MRRNEMMGGRLFGATVALTAVLVVAGCEGSNLFSVNGQAGGGAAAGEDTGAPTVTIQSPRGDSLSALPVGDSLLVEAHVADDIGVTSVSFYGIAERGDKNLGTDEVVQRFRQKTILLPAGVTDTTLTRYLEPTADTTRETVEIVVEATDSTGNMTADTVSMIVGGPSVQLVNLPDPLEVTPGKPWNVYVLAKDPLGIKEIGVSISGPAGLDTVLVRTLPVAQDSVLFDTTMVIPASDTGTISLLASATNALRVTAHDGPITLQLRAAAAGDTIPPRLMQSLSAPDRMELQDSITVKVTGQDNTGGDGVKRIGFTVLAISPTRGDTAYMDSSVVLDSAVTGTISRTFRFAPFNVDSLALPDTLVFEISSWMMDASTGGNCGVTVGDTLTALPCGTLNGMTVASGRSGERLQRPIVAGRTVALPGGGRIMDAAVDTTPGRRKLYLSNISRNRLEVFDMDSDQFETAIGVGSEPWGLAFSRSGDSLWVANSGGTNLDVVRVSTGEDVGRFYTPDVHLFDVERKQGQSGAIQYLVTTYPQDVGASFSDRPQYVAVDYYGNLIYSTKTTDIGDLGTARKAYYQAGWDAPEAKMFVEHADNNESEDHWALAHIDSLMNISIGDSIGGGFFDHKPGFPNDVITTTLSSADADPVCGAAERLRADGSDVYCQSASTWNIGSVTFRDTTYVAASGDGRWVSIGEGGTEPVGRVLTYQARLADTTSLTRYGQVSNLLQNSAEEVRGLGLNYDGTLGVVRGRLAAYFISPRDLLLQGSTEIPNASKGHGAVLHPLHADAPNLDNLGGAYHPDTQLAFVATGDYTIDVIDTQRFTRIGRIYTRDLVSGPLRAVLPFPQDNAGLTCGKLPVYDRRGDFIGNAIQLYNGGDFNSPIPPNGSTDDRCVVVKLFGATDSGGVVVINVRKGEILRDHPARQN